MHLICSPFFPFTVLLVASLYQLLVIENPLTVNHALTISSKGLVSRHRAFKLMYNQIPVKYVKHSDLLLTGHILLFSTLY